MKLYEHKYMDFLLKDDRIDFIWKADTEDMDDYGFKWSILRYASFAMEYRVTKVLIDLTDFKFTPSEEAGQFHSDYVTNTSLSASLMPLAIFSAMARVPFHMVS